MYCICSNKSLDEIVLAQKTKVLPFEQAIDKYTSCNAARRLRRDASGSLRSALPTPDNAP
jgi:hypothetical protein